MKSIIKLEGRNMLVFEKMVLLAKIHAKAL
jgi:hypothetical protein